MRAFAPLWGLHQAWHNVDFEMNRDNRPGILLALKVLCFALVLFNHGFLSKFAVTFIGQWNNEVTDLSTMKFLTAWVRETATPVTDRTMILNSKWIHQWPFRLKITILSLSNQSVLIFLVFLSFARKLVCTLLRF